MFIGFAIQEKKSKHKYFCLLTSKSCYRNLAIFFNTLSSSQVSIDSLVQFILGTYRERYYYMG